MAGCARREILREAEIGTYHGWSKCTQRAFLCGYDQERGINYHDRRRWIETLLHSIRPGRLLSFLGPAVWLARVARSGGGVGGVRSDAGGQRTSVVAEVRGHC